MHFHVHHEKVLRYLQRFVALLSLAQISQSFIISHGIAKTSFSTCSQGRCISSKLFQSSTSSLSSENKTVVIIGGGWAGFSAAETLSSSILLEQADNKHVNIILLDASKKARGGLAGGWDTEEKDDSKNKKTIEMGIHGFWREYRNTFDIISNIKDISNLDQVLTPYIPSILVSEKEKIAVAPVLNSKSNNNTTKLPPPIDLAIQSNIKSVSPADLASGINLLPYYADFIPNDEASWKRYDSISAENLFLQKAKLSPNLYQKLALPLLHVLPMTTGWDCSAAAALSCFHVFALQSYGAFDVRWCRESISKAIFEPWEKQLLQRNVQVKGGALVTNIHKHKDELISLSLSNGESIKANDVIFAVGGPSMKKMIQYSPYLQKVIPNHENFTKLRGITCVSVRLFLQITKPLTLTNDKPSNCPWVNEMQESPVVVCGPNILPELVETGFCIYDLQRMQDQYAQESVVEVDFFRANVIANCNNDQQIVDLTLRAISAALTGSDVYDTNLVKVQDVLVNRARNAVSHFCIGSASSSPSVKLAEHLYACGDWVDRKGHSSWSTEKSVVTGRQAAAALLQSYDLNVNKKHKVIDEVQEYQELKEVRKAVKGVRDVFGDFVPSVYPWEAVPDFFFKVAEQQFLKK